MSKMKRVKPPDFLNGDSAAKPLDFDGALVPEDFKRIDDNLTPAGSTPDFIPAGFVDLLAPAKTIADAADRKPLAKVEVNDETPRCPLCRSVRINEIRLLGSFNRFCCVDCQASFRDPVFGAAA